MQTKTTFKSLSVIICLLLQFHLQAQGTIHVATAGTLPSRIAEDQKYQITELTLTGNLNGTDIKYIREMAGSDVSGNTTDYGKLAILNLADANIVSGGDVYYDYYYANNYYSYSTENNSISSYMFFNCTKLTNVILPNNVTSIEASALSYTGLTSITIPDGVTSIGSLAFAFSGLTSITIPDGVTLIGDGAFAYCTVLTSVTLPNSLTSIGDEAFSVCNSLVSITIPDGVTSIGDVAFGSCSSLPSITIPNGVTSIGYGTFSGCIGLTSITIPNNVTSIEEGAFWCCSSLTSVTIPNSVTSIEEGAFANCSLLAAIHSRIVTPPSITSSVFDAYYGVDGVVDKTTCILYVPRGSLDAYRQTPVWQDFLNIIEEDAPTGIVPETDGILPTLSIHSVSGGIAIETKEAIPVAVYNVFGQKIYESLINGNREINLNKGIYVVKAKKESQKVIVK